MFDINETSAKTQRKIAFMKALMIGLAVLLALNLLALLVYSRAIGLNLFISALSLGLLLIIIFLNRQTQPYELLLARVAQLESEKEQYLVDIIERARVEETIRVREAEAKRAWQFLTKALENMKDGLALADENNSLILCNEQYRRLFPKLRDILVPGVSAQEVIQAMVETGQIVFQENSAGEVTAADRLETLGADRKFQYLTSEGVWVEARDYPMPDGGWLGIRIDITERKDAEIALRRSEETARVILDASPDAITLVDREGIILAVNAAFAEGVGQTAQAVVGQSSYDLLIDELAQDRKVLVDQAIETGRPVNYQLNSQDRSIDVFIYPVADGQGTIKQVVTFSRDVTKQRQLENQLLASLAEKEVLLKEIHHRVKNNMQVISSLLDLQSGYITDKAVREMIQGSRERVRSMALVHEQLYQTADLARVDFAQYVEQLTGLLARSYDQTAGYIDLQLTVESVRLSVETAVPLGLIINELVSNAYKHAFADGRSGQITVELQVDSLRTICLIVQDNGLGMPAELDFRHVSSLGLTIVSTLIDQLGGQIALDRSQGTRFEMSAPLADA